MKSFLETILGGALLVGILYAIVWFVALFIPSMLDFTIWGIFTLLILGGIITVCYYGFKIISAIFCGTINTAEKIYNTRDKGILIFLISAPIFGCLLLYVIGKINP